METKVVRRPGSSATRPVDLDRVWLHFTGTYVVGTDEERPFASCVMGEDPFSIVLGQDQTIVGLEMLLKSMTEGEVAGVRLPPDLCFGAGGNPHKFHGRGEPIPPNASLIFEVQLVAFEPTMQLTERAAAPLTERFVFAAARKQVANEAFQASLLPKAMVLYAQCIALIEDSREAAHKELQVQLHSNLAACKARFGRWREVIALCTTALGHDASHAKSLFRRGRAYLSTGKYEEARADLRRAAEVEPNDKEIKSELKRLEDLLSRMQVKEKAFAQNMVQGIREANGPLVPERAPDPEEQFAKCNICGVKVEKVQLARHVIKAHSDAVKDA